MKRSILILALSALTILYSCDGYQLEDGGKIWALLVAGSNDYSNYRHQADVCHAYQILHKNGIPDENIIVMMYDDIANNEANPTKGVIINRPNGSDVYHGVLKDYVGADVNPQNFLNVLTGNKSAMKGIGSGRVIESGPKDHVFVNFVDHGAPGLLAFPTSELYAPKLLTALKKMAAKKKFSKLVLYVEACESGSMFDSILPDDLGIFVMTAADPNESSYACYFDTERETYLGDVFSVMWMQDSEEENLLRETLHHQYEVVRTETNTSHVEEYGDLDIGSMHVSDFLGFQTTSSINAIPNLPSMNDAIPNPHVPVAILEKKMEKAEDAKEKKELSFKLHRLLKYRLHMENVVKDILMVATGKDEQKVEELKFNRYTLKLRDYNCYEALVSSFSEKCFAIHKNSYALRQIYMFANACGHDKVDSNSVLNAIDTVCSTLPKLNGIV